MTYISQNAHARVLDPVVLLVDGENLSAVYAQEVIETARKYGEPTVRRVYGKAEQIAGWEQEGYRLVPSRHGKNSADILLCVEAMSLALREKFHTVLIGSSDKDYAYLCEHLRELGHQVIGIGEAKAAASFRKACSVFVELEAVKQPQIVVRPPGDLVPQILKVLPGTILQDGWATATWVEHQLRKENPSFDPREYGAETLVEVVVASGYFETVGSTSNTLKLRDPVAQRVKPLPKLPALPSELDLKLKAKIGLAGMEMVALGNAMKSDKKVKGQTGHATWRQYLATKPDLFRFDGTKVFCRT